MRLFALALLAPLLSGCMAAGPILTVASVISTAKTPIDYVVSWATEKDCSAVNKTRDDPYCEERAPPQQQRRAHVYCYRTLGEVTCYDREDPYNGRQGRVGG